MFSWTRDAQIDCQQILRNIAKMSANEVTNNLKGKIITKPQVLKWHVVQVGDFKLFYFNEKVLPDVKCNFRTQKWRQVWS